MKPLLRIIIDSDEGIEFYISDNEHLFETCELLDKLKLNWEFI